MTDGRNFSLPRLGGKPSPPEPAYTDLIELLPHGVVVIDGRTRRIEATNKRFQELTHVSAAELLGQEVDALLPGWESGAAAIWVESILPHNKTTAATAAAPNPTLPLARIHQTPTLPKGKRLLIIEAGSPRADPILQEKSNRYWDGLARLMEALQETELAAALEIVQSVGREILEGEELAIYRLESDRLILKRCCGPNGGNLPDEMPAQEMASLNRLRLWVAGKRPVCELHRYARAAQMAYLASVPIGQPGAIIGFIAATGRTIPNGPAPQRDDPRAGETVLPILRLLATLATGIFERHIWTENLEARIESQERRLRLETALANYSVEGLLVLDPDLQVLRLNSAAEMMFGYAASEVIGHVVEKILIGPEALQPALNAAQSGSPTYNLGNVRLYRRDGESFLALVRIYPVEFESQVEHLLVLIQDLSEQEQVRLQTQQLEQQALLGEVTAVFAHEVRNPINNISTGLQVMGMNLPATDPNQATIARMLQDCDRLAELLKSVLAFSKPAEYEMESLDLGVLLRRLLERLHPRIVRQNIQYDLRVDENCPRIQGNLRALEQVFNNLIQNALQAMIETGGHLILKTCPVSEDGLNYLEISVADTGPGIPKEVQDRVFQPFFTTEKGGTGLGLAIVKRIVTAHKGIITLTSFPGGTIFRVRLPAE